MINTLLEEKEKYLHYVAKLKRLQQEKIDKEKKGGQLSKGATEQLNRNVGKLERAASSYKVVLRKLKDETDDMMARRLKTVNPILNGMYGLDVIMWKEIGSDFQNLPNLHEKLKDYTNLESYK